MITVEVVVVVEGDYCHNLSHSALSATAAARPLPKGTLWCTGWVEALVVSAEFPIGKDWCWGRLFLSQVFFCSC